MNPHTRSDEVDNVLILLDSHSLCTIVCLAVTGALNQRPV